MATDFSLFELRQIMLVALNEANNSIGKQLVIDHVVVRVKLIDSRSGRFILAAGSRPSRVEVFEFSRTHNKLQLKSNDLKL